jgi:pyruvate/2-oxoglutarate dehydrogenase complex dihydrolipoamide dehydrogenase (E3) component
VSERYDAVVIGAGPAGEVAVSRLWPAPAAMDESAAARPS